MAKLLVGLLIFVHILSIIPLSELARIRLENEKKPGKDFVNGVVLKTLAYDYPPFFSAKKLPGGNFTYGGVSYELLALMSQYFNCRFELIFMEPWEITKYGITESLRNYLYNNAVDIVSFPFESSLDNLKYMANSQPFWIGDYSLLQPWPNEESRLRILIRPFSYLVWICLWMSILAFISITSTFIFVRYHAGNAYFQEELTNEPCNNLRKSYGQIFYHQMHYVLTIITNQGNSVPFVILNLRLVTAIWLLCMVVCINAYTGVLTAMLSIPKLEKTIETLDELAISSRFKITKESHSHLTTQLLEATSGTYKILGDELRRNPEQLFNDLLQVIDLVVNHDSVFPTVRMMNNFIIKEDTKSHGKCRMTSSIKSLPYAVTTFQGGFPKSSPYVDLFDRYPGKT